MKSKLVFNSVPNTWEEFLPLGNGRLGAMVKAGVSNEIYQQMRTYSRAMHEFTSCIARDREKRTVACKKQLFDKLEFI